MNHTPTPRRAEFEHMLPPVGMTSAVVVVVVVAIEMDNHIPSVFSRFLFLPNMFYSDFAAAGATRAALSPRFTTTIPARMTPAPMVISRVRGSPPSRQPTSTATIVFT